MEVAMFSGTIFWMISHPEIHQLKKGLNKALIDRERRKAKKGND
jgi:hypothetical protein